MPLYKIINYERTERKCVVASTLEELAIKGARKLNICEEGVTFVTEKDGMEVDEDEVLAELSEETLMLLEQRQKWKCQETLVVIEGQTEPAKPEEVQELQHLNKEIVSTKGLSPSSSVLANIPVGNIPAEGDQRPPTNYSSVSIQKEKAPYYSPLIQRHLDEGNIEVVWNKFIGETANYYYGKFPDIGSHEQYRAIGEKIYHLYPCIKNEGSHPWSLFTKSLSQRIRHMRLNLKRKSQPTVQHEGARPKSKMFKTVTESQPSQDIEEDAKMHLKELDEEWKKSEKNRNKSHIRTLLNETRLYRERLVQKSQRLLKDIVLAVPCFTDGEYILYELKRKHGKEKLETMLQNAEILILACHDLIGKPLDKDILSAEGKDIHREVMQAVILMEKESKFDRGKSGKIHFDSIAKVFEDADDSMVTEKLKTKEGSAPHLCVFIDEGKLKAVFIVGDDISIRCFGDCLLLGIIQLISVYYIFDIDYPKCYAMFMTLLQIFVFEENNSLQTSKKFNFFIKKLKSAFVKQKNLYHDKV